MRSGVRFGRAGLITAISLVVGLSTFGALLKQPGPRQATAARIVISVPPVESAASVASEPAVAEPLAATSASVATRTSAPAVNEPVGAKPANIAVRAPPPAAEEPVGTITPAPSTVKAASAAQATAPTQAPAPQMNPGATAPPASTPAVASASPSDGPVFPPMQTHEGAQAVVPPLAAATPDAAAEGEKPASKKKSKRADKNKRKAPVRPAPYEIREFFAGRW